MMELGVQRRNQWIVHRDWEPCQHLIPGHEGPDDAIIGASGHQFRLSICSRCAEVAKGLPEIIAVEHPHRRGCLRH